MPHDVINPLVDRLELMIKQAEDAGRKEDWTAVLLLLKEALATAERLSDASWPEQPAKV